MVIERLLWGGNVAQQYANSPCEMRGCTLLEMDYFKQLEHEFLVIYLRIKALQFIFFLLVLSYVDNRGICGSQP
ncbi:MAG: hypothetical protein A2Z14_17250 [Chloroflexi bacterium RBG_16_48_8]|nr:MAG: hypothetical protein A2Z14_17250 [Chloroflexi bacterium RBG_16_48_8]